MEGAHVVDGALNGVVELHGLPQVEVGDIQGVGLHEEVVVLPFFLPILLLPDMPFVLLRKPVDLLLHIPRDIGLVVVEIKLILYSLYIPMLGVVVDVNAGVEEHSGLILF